MGTKTITITNEAYERLVTYKEQKESFSEVIKKITQKGSLFDLIGILTDKEAEKLKKHRKDVQKEINKHLERRKI